MIISLLAILFLLLVLINKNRGVKSFLSLFINYLFLVITITLISLGLGGIILSLIFSIGISGFILFYINGFNKKTKIAFISSAIILILLTLLIMLIRF